VLERRRRFLGLEEERELEMEEWRDSIMDERVMWGGGGGMEGFIAKQRRMRRVEGEVL